MTRYGRSHFVILMVAIICIVLGTASTGAYAHGVFASQRHLSRPDSVALKSNRQKVITIKQVAFTADGGWLVLYGTDGYTAEGMPTELTDVLDQLNQDKQEIHFVSFTASGAWAVVSGKPGGVANAVNWKGIPQTAIDKLKSLNDNGFEFRDISFSADDEWVILYGSNRYAASKGMKSEVTDKLDELIKATRTLKQVIFTGSGDWIILYNDNRYAASGIGKGLTDELKKVNTQNYRLTRLAFTLPFTADGSAATPDATTSADSGVSWIILYGANGVVYSDGIPDKLLDRLKDLNSGIE